MTCHRLYCPTLTEGVITLSGEESHHASHVLRLKQGEGVFLFDGAGHEATALVDVVGKGGLQVRVDEIRECGFDLPWRITMAVALPKAHRQAYLIEKCTELGVAAIWPVIAERSVTKPDRGAVEKWSRRALEAAKQSRRRWLPEIVAPQGLSTVADRIGEFTAAGLVDPEMSATPIQAFLESVAGRKGARSPQTQANAILNSLPSILFMVGPEGGWTTEERQRAKSAGAVAVRLGPTMLRTETAAVAVCAAAALWND